MSRRAGVVVFVVAAVAVTVGSLFAAHHETKPRIFGLYTADVQPGHGAEYASIVEKDILPIFKKHDIELIGAFNSAIGGSSNQMVLLVGATKILLTCRLLTAIRI